jgi:transcription antitermination factor NusA-like protein
MKVGPKRPSLSRPDIATKIKELEFQQRSTTMSAAAERTLLRTIADLKKQLSTFDEWDSHEAEIEALRAKRKEASERLKAVVASLKGLRDGVRKLDVAERVAAANPGIVVELADVRTEELAVSDESLLPRIIGKKGSGLREIEAACAVVLDVDDERRRREGGEEGGAAAAASPSAASGACIRITGLEAGRRKARERIEALFAAEEASYSVSPGVASALIAKAAAAVKDLEANLDVRIRVERGEDGVGSGGKVLARGSSASLALLARQLAAAENAKATLTVEGRQLPSLIGKGGAHLKKLREDFGVEVDISRAAGAEGSRDAPATLTVASFGPGAPAAVARGLAALRALLDEHGEHEETVALPHDAIPWLVGKGGERIQAFQKETGIFARVVRAEAGAAEDAPAGLSLRGTRAALASAKPALEALLYDFHRSNVTLHFSGAQARALIGPAGATVKALRAESGAQIDVDEATGGGKAAAAAAAAAATASAAEAKEGGSKAPRAPRVNRADEAGLAAGTALVMIRGEPEKVAAAVAAVRAVVASTKEVRITVPAAAASALVRNKGELVRAMEAECGATIDVAKPGEGGAAAGATVLTITGTAPTVAAAEAKLAAFLANRKATRVALPSSAVIAEVVGKGGANIRALQSETGLEDIDIDKAGGAVILTGSAEAVAAAEARLAVTFARFAKENAVLRVDRSFAPLLVGKGGAAIRALQEETGATVHVSDDGEVRVHGPEAAVEAALAKIRATARVDAASEDIRVDPSVLGAVIGKGGINLRRLGEAHGVVIGADSDNARLTIRGEPAALAAAKAALLRQASDAGRAEGEIKIAAAGAGSVIGTGGAILRATEAATGASI